MILLIDNYDSFSFNLYQFLGEWEPDILVVRNDEMTLEEIRAKQPDKIVLSPGPGRPEDAGNIIDVVKTLGKDIPILGVCLDIRPFVLLLVLPLTMPDSLCMESNLKSAWI